MTKSASVEQSAPNKPPKLLPGKLTPEVARDWDNACSTYFMHKGVDAADQVKMIAFGMLDPRLHTWYLAQRATLDGGTFANYMTALKAGWLDTHWDTKLRKKVLGSRQGTRPFYEWALELQNQNALLYGNAAHLSDIQLRNQLEANICDELTTSVLRAKLADNLTLRKWIEEVKHLDDKRLEDFASHKKIAEELYKSSRRTTTSYQSKTPSSSKTFNSSSRLGPLTESERNLLVEHKGCFKCRKFYVSHRSKECNDGAPEASTYKPLTEADANAAKPKATRAKTVAAVAPVGAVMPSSVFEEGSESEDDKYVAPFETAHLIWPCLLTGPSSESFERIDALIDHGSHLVLIDESVVDKLGLRKRKLHTSIEASSAFLNSASVSPFSFSEYVLLSPSSINHDWTSHHDLRTCIAKDSKYDLLSPPKHVRKCRTPLPSRREIKRQRKNVIKELQKVLEHRGNELEQHTTSKNTNIASVLRQRIETLAFIEANKEHLERLDKEMRRKYEDRFPEDIPHIDHLPTDIVHRIRLKDPNKIIQCRRYNTPRKYREAWDTLLNQHIAAGRLRPSSSPFVSPAFLIPKKDPTALP
ncbi:uncharacterized protein HD556DRAFT_1472931 [Suillus plorans]|uniref:Retrotransposon gag domain-containing protein n=1 Tax=Suillus plorans TaxID=116603 RepID=A0A9P7ATY2_9AGAM|nr:uncharacterized protein HD556DRAFT_1472931 [Suillus plorans]KAG1795413.1 hypothetical protein HD556DRAFT_1472931 [Suillus plorans]